MKKILFIIGQLGAGGAERVLIDIANDLSKNRKYSVTIFTFCKNKLDSQISKDVRHISFFNIDVSSKKIISKILSRIVIKNFFKLLEKINANKIRKIMSFCLKDTYDFEVAFVEGLPIKISSSSRHINSLKRIGWIHTDLSTYNHGSQFFENYSNEKDSYNNLDEMIFVSEQAQQGYCKYFNGNHHNSFVVPNILNIERIKTLSQQKVNLDFKYICSVGRLVKEKGYDRLIIAFNTLKKQKKLNDLKLVLIGSGPEEENLKNSLQEYGLVDEVIFIPFSENPYKFIKNSEFFISSSRTEGYSLVVAEAILLETPVISTRTGAISILGEGNYGLVTDNSLEGIVKGLEKIYMEKDKYKGKAISGSSHIEMVNKQNSNKIISLF
ncbi:glycosyl transferase [Bacillus sp. AFS026049]|uniref:glycosyltransferase n=1 Tax=Peribacillus frigoritolerans TaxID=450367 RepID=UPI000BF59F3B|nr:glycosyl transferase [Bacillus sp. AFS026049]